jgi:type III secretion protein U
MSEKTLKPTARKLREARKQGEVVHSRDLSSVSTFAVLWICLGLCAGNFWTHLRHITEQGLLAAADSESSQAWLSSVQSIAIDAAWIVGPLLVLVIASSVLIGGLQTRGIFSTAPLTPKFDRLNPAEGLRRIFSTRSLLELGMMLLKTALLLALLFYCIRSSYDSLVKTIYTAPSDVLRVAAVLLWHLMGWAILIYAIGAALDYAHQLYEFMKQHKMSIEEVRRELKDTEGDPRIKARRRSLGRQMILDPVRGGGGLAQRLATASVVIVNPTHVSVALSYARGKTPLPRVVAKGLDQTALRIRREAERLRLPVLEDPPLARRLFREVALDQYIREELIDSVAAVFRWVRLTEPRRASVRLARPEAEAKSTYGVYEPGEIRTVDLAAQPGDVHVDNVVQGGGAADVLPDLVR